MNPEDKKTLTAIIVLAVLIGGAALYETYRVPVQPVGGTAGAHCGGFIKNAPTCAAGFHCQLTISNPDTGGTCVPDAVSAASYKDATYIIDGQKVTLSGGAAEMPAAPGSATMVHIQYFGNDATGDLDGDGVPDVAFLFTMDGGGSGTFYYVTAALKTDTGYKGTSAIIIGDRIAPQTTEIRNGLVIVNYADRKKDEPMTTPPSVGNTRYYSVIGGSLARIPNPAP